MTTILATSAFWRFSVFNGIGAMLVFDLWCLLTRAMGVVICDWSLMGRWVLGRINGRKSVCEGCRVPYRKPVAHKVHLFCLSRCGRSYRPGMADSLIGWVMHCGMSIFVAALLPLIWGHPYLMMPTLAPTLLVGFCLPSVIGQIVTIPAVSRAFARKENEAPFMLHVLMLAGNAVFAMALFASARHGMILFRNCFV